MNQQWPFNPETPDGAWGFHNKLIPESPVKPLRIWMAVGDRDNYNPNVMRDDMHDWVAANQRHGHRFEGERLSTINTCIASTLGTVSAMPSHKSCRRRWSGFGKAIPSHRLVKANQLGILVNMHRAHILLVLSTLTATAKQAMTRTSCRKVATAW
ncbi:MAG: hypothetical protein V9G29_04450 [Burkholderiaceae bacterium]